MTNCSIYSDFKTWMLTSIAFQNIYSNLYPIHLHSVAKWHITLSIKFHYTKNVLCLGLFWHQNLIRTVFMVSDLVKWCTVWQEYLEEGGGLQWKIVGLYFYSTLWGYFVHHWLDCFKWSRFINNKILTYEWLTKCEVYLLNLR